MFVLNLFLQVIG